MLVIIEESHVHLARKPAGERLGGKLQNSMVVLVDQHAVVGLRHDDHLVPVILVQIDNPNIPRSARKVVPLDKLAGKPLRVRGGGENVQTSTTAIGGQQIGWLPTVGRSQYAPH